MVQGKDEVIENQDAEIKNRSIENEELKSKLTAITRGMELWHEAPTPRNAYMTL